MNFKKTLITGLLSTSILFCSFSNTSYAAPKEIPQLPEEVSFEEFEVWYNENFDELRKNSDDYKTDQEILDEIKTSNNSGNMSTQTSDGTVSIAASYVPGDILVTDVNDFMGWNHGHAALVQSSLYTTEILGVGDDLTANRSISTYWTNRYSSAMAHLRTAMYSSYQAGKAKDWLYNQATTEDIGYNVAYGVYNTTTTYCSKSAWQAWYYGAGIELVAPSGGHVLPKMLYTSQNLSILSSNIGTWG